MKNLTLDFGARLGLASFLGQTTGPLAKISSLQRIHNVVRFSDEDASKIEVKPLGNGVSTFIAPSPEFGRLEAPLEDADITVLLAELDSFPNFRISDMAWVQSVRSQLNGIGK